MARSHSSVSTLSPTSNGTQDVISAGLSTPIGALFMGTRGGSMEALEPDATPFIGATDFTDNVAASSSSLTQGRAVALESGSSLLLEDGHRLLLQILSQSDTSHISSIASCIYQGARDASTSVTAANHNALVTDGLQLDFTTTAASDLYSTLMLREGISGVKVRDISLAASGTTDVDITSTSLLPDATIFICSGAATGGGDEAYHAVGFYSAGDGTYFSSAATSRNGQSTTFSERRASAAEVIVRMDHTSGARDAVTIGSIPGGTGYRLTKTSGSTAVNVYAVELRIAQGYELKVGNFTTPASGITGNHRVIQDLGFNPQLVFFTGCPVSAVETDTSNSLFGFGWASFDGTQAVIGSADNSGVTASSSPYASAVSYQSSNHCIAVPDVADDRMDILASMLAFNAENAISLDFTKNTIGSQIMGYMAIGKSDDVSSAKFPVKRSSQTIKMLASQFDHGAKNQHEYEFGSGHPGRHRFYQGHGDT